MIVMKSKLARGVDKATDPIETTGFGPALKQPDLSNHVAHLSNLTSEQHEIIKNQIIPLLKNRQKGDAAFLLRFDKNGQELEISMKVGNLKEDDEKIIVDILIEDFIARYCFSPITILNYYQALALPNKATTEEIKERCNLTQKAIQGLKKIISLEVDNSKTSDIEQTLNLASTSVENAQNTLLSNRKVYDSELVKAENELQKSNKLSYTPKNLPPSIKTSEQDAYLSSIKEVAWQTRNNEDLQFKILKKLNPVFKFHPSSHIEESKEARHILEHNIAVQKPKSPGNNEQPHGEYSDVQTAKINKNENRARG